MHLPKPNGTVLLISCNFTQNPSSRRDNNVLRPSPVNTMGRRKNHVGLEENPATKRGGVTFTQGMTKSYLETKREQLNVI